MINKVILAIDLGTTLGWAVLDETGNIASGFEQLKHKGKNSVGVRYMLFGQWLKLTHDRVYFDKVYYEEVRRHLGTTASHVYGGFLGVLSAFCESESIMYAGVPVGTIKKTVTGKGNADKHRVISAVNMLGHAVTDHNEADAIAILYSTEPKKIKFNGD